ncbi:hypothetical protein DY000_02031517 [Brassica cretica]|uniref:Uncharacterized protein n=1 Tax=Brassica cretica TaxID=69181 RepID=A0ABQ7DV84_BRACR|nr:hypothetical protein DY000_02031517 [Brassica cretica]
MKYCLGGCRIRELWSWMFSLIDGRVPLLLRKISISSEAGETIRPGSRKTEPGGGTLTRGKEPGTWNLEPLRPYKNPKVSSLDPEIFDKNPEENPEVLPQILYIGPEIVWGTLGFLFRSGACIRARSSLGTRNILLFAGTVLRLSRQGYYRYLFGFRIMPLGSWPISSSYVVFYFCRKSLIGFRGCWCGCYDPSARLHCFPRLEKQEFDCSMYFTVLLQ